MRYIFIYIHDMICKLFINNLYTVEHPKAGPEIMMKCRTFRQGCVWWFFISQEMTIQLCGWVKFLKPRDHTRFADVWCLLSRFCGHVQRAPPNPLIYHNVPIFKVTIKWGISAFGHTNVQGGAP